VVQSTLNATQEAGTWLLIGLAIMVVVGLTRLWFTDRRDRQRPIDRLAQEDRRRQGPPRCLP
jgi:hypothetical protein